MSEPTVPTFEASMKRLGEIVAALESGELSLEDSLRMFEEGVALSRGAQSRLDGVERRIEELLSVDDAGNPRSQPLPER